MTATDIRWGRQAGRGGVPNRDERRAVTLFACSAGHRWWCDRSVLGTAKCLIDGRLLRLAS